MKAIIFNGSLKSGELPVPVPSPGEVLVRVLLAGICNTDIEILKGYMGFSGVLGHEFVGLVESLGHPLEGKRVVGEINLPCRTCHLCMTGRSKHCTCRTTLGIHDRNGIFAEYVTLPEFILHVVPETVPDEAAVFTEPLAAACEIFEQIMPEPGQRWFVFGGGKLGLLVAMTARAKNLLPLVIDHDQEKVRLAGSLGLEAIHAAELDRDVKAEVCIDCTGDPLGAALCLQHLNPCGTLVMKTTVAAPAGLNLNQVVINEFRITGSRCGPFDKALDLLESGAVNPLPLISRTFPLEHGLEAFSYAREKGVNKVLLKCSG